MRPVPGLVALAAGGLILAALMCIPRTYSKPGRPPRKAPNTKQSEPHLVPI